MQIDPNVPTKNSSKRGTRFRPVLRRIRRIALVVIGALFFATALRGLIQPNQLLSGGVAGASLLLNRLAGIPLGLMLGVLNLPIFLLGIRDMGRGFALLSMIGVAATWTLVDAVPFPPLTGDPLLAGVFGGVFAGIGSALALKAGGSLGGFDILGLVINRRFGLGVGEVLLATNGLLVVTSGLLGSPELALYTLVAIYTSGKAIDALLAPRRRKTFLIMTQRPAPIRERVLKQMDRGMTVFHAEGGYTGAEIATLLCVVTRAEIQELVEITRSEDPAAFVVVLEASQVMGSFRSTSAAAYWKRLHDPLMPPSRS